MPHTPACSASRHLSRSPLLHTRPSVHAVFKASIQTVGKRQLATLVRSEVKPGPQAGRGSYPDDPDKAAQLKGVAEKMDAFFASIFHFWLHQDLEKKDGGGNGEAQAL